MKIILAIAFLALASAVPTPAVQPQAIRLPEAPKPYLDPTEVEVAEETFVPYVSEADSEFTVNVVDSPVIEEGTEVQVVEDAEPETAKYIMPIDISPALVAPEVMAEIEQADYSIQVVEAPVEVQLEAIHLPEAPVPYVEEAIQIIDVLLIEESLGQYIPVLENMVEEIPAEAVRVVESPAQDLPVQELEAEPVKVVETVQELEVEPVMVVESPAEDSFQKIAPSELESIRVVLPEAVRVVEMPVPRPVYANPMARSM